MTKYKIIVDYPDPEYTEPELPSHRMGRMVMHAELEAERDRRPRRRSGQIFLRAAAYVTEWCALLALAVYALSHAGF